MRWYTCTPIAFGGGEDFFARDSGLMCRGFQSLGIESRAVMPLPAGADDSGDLIRTEFADLESAAWWRSQNLDGVVLYAWGRPRFRKVAAAIRQAGILLVLNQDNGGLVSPLAGFRGWVLEQWIMTGRGGSAGNWGAFLKLLVRGLSVGLLVTDPLRAQHLRQGNVIACVSPAAAAHYRRLCRIYGGKELAQRVEMLPHPVEATFTLAQSPAPKARQIVCVGRWQAILQKRPLLMQAVLQDLLEKDPGVDIEIVGDATDGLARWHQSLRSECQSRVHLRGRIDRVQLGEILRRSQIFYSPSAFESFGIAAGEALCCGCTVVAKHSVSMASFEWFVSENSGRLAATDDVQGHLRALEEELACWDKGERNPDAISKSWNARLHADRVAERILNFKF